MVNLRQFCISGGIFSGFETYVDLDKTDSLNDIIYCMSDTLKEKLWSIKLHDLSNSVDPSVYHIHDYTFEDILISESTQVFYICNHC
tara:strand:- start:1104 stop:1364 length:261 start_codon:yes stop_codon:yes gene_type:complete